MPGRPVVRPVAALALLLAAAAPLRAQPVQEAARPPDWPCVQVYVPELSPGLLWSGPDPEAVEPRWRDDAAVRRAAALATAPGATASAAAFDEAVAAVAESAGAERNQALTALFAAVYETQAARRREALQVIGRYARQQDALHAAIARTLATLDTAPPGSAEAATAEQALQWQRRILDDRRRALEAVCEQPVLVEQRLGVLTRTIAARLD